MSTAPQKKIVIIDDDRTVQATLSAVLQPEGLRVGDVVDFSFTISGVDPVLQGMAQLVLVPPQVRAEKVHLRASWPRMCCAACRLRTPTFTR